MPASHTVLTEQMGGATVYVGMTRGRNENTLHVVAESMADARAQFIEAIERDRADRGLADATERAAEAVRGLVADGPVKLVNDEVVRLLRDAERTAEKWEQIAERLDQQQANHQAEDEQSAEMIRAAETHTAQARAEVVAELVPQAVEDGETYLTAVTAESTTSERLATSGRFGRRRARQEYQAATERTHTAREQVRDAWGVLPRHGDGLTEWATTAAERRAENDPRVIDADRRLADAQSGRAALKDQHNRERLTLLARELGVERVRRDPIRARFIRPDREARNVHAQAAVARRDAEELRALPPEQAAVLVEVKRAAAEQVRPLRGSQGDAPPNASGGWRFQRRCRAASSARSNVSGSRTDRRVVKPCACPSRLAVSRSERAASSTVTRFGRISASSPE
ncbi:hypothetical protein [Citricoccus sp. NR2]|uniref:hypothetical protein n=1 Tax=Citricoccus sp. NR2 TaxID=3004095 RepID=UPI0022DD81D6|nr:hypothetical protein [Citricoccus sp. NR2]WBL19856.1 hypothetical protein O1A05_03945 [Citricoccus sp. NR2]